MAEPAALELHVPGYVLGERLGAGGFGEVFRARHAVIDRDVAIKILHASCSDDENAVQRFIAEARAVNKISHPGIVEIFDFGRTADGRQYCVMELLRGKTLREALADKQRYTLEEALPILRAVAEAVDAAHAAGIAHRDLKPDNVFLTDRGVIKLIDFGLAKLVRDDPDATPVTRTGAIFGTPRYMSPEQCRGKASDLRTDCYSFGVLAYEMLTGTPPFSGDALEVALHHLNDPPEPPSQRADVPVSIDEPILALLAKSPSARPVPLSASVDRLERPRRSYRRIAIGALGVVTFATAIAWPAARIEQRFTTRELPMRADTGLSGEARFSGDGKAVLYNGRTTMWKVDVATASTEQFAPPATGNEPMGDIPLRDGRWVITREGGAIIDPEKAKLFLVERDGSMQFLLDGVDPSVSDDGTKLALFQRGSLVVYDFATKATRKLADADRRATFARPRWSRDGKRLVWFVSNTPDERPIRITEVATGETRTVDLPLFNPVHPMGGASFLDDGRIVYCRKGVVVARDIDTNAESTIATLPPEVMHCYVDSMRGRVILLLGSLQRQVGVIRESSKINELRMVSVVGSGLTAIDPTNKRAYVFTRGKLTKEAPTIPPGDPELVELDIETSRTKSVSTCPGDRGAAWFSGALAHVELPDGVLRLRAHESCAVIAEWTLPAADWSMPRCHERTCYTTRTIRNAATSSVASSGMGGVTSVESRSVIEVWRLVANEPAKLLASANAGSDAPTGYVAISPTGTHLAIGANAGALHVITTADGAVRHLPMDGWIKGVAWGNDPEHFIVVGQLFGEAQYALRRVALDGTFELGWVDTTIMLSNPSFLGGDLVASMFVNKQQLLLLERSPVGPVVH